MEVKINLNEEQVHKILKMNGYTTENVLVYYNLYEDYILDGEPMKMGSYYLRVAYPEGQRPIFFEHEKIMANDARYYAVDNVVNSLFKITLLRLMGI